MIQNSFDENQFLFDDLCSVHLEGCSVASTNGGNVSRGPFPLSQLDMEEGRRGIGVDLISVRQVEDVFVVVLRK